MINIVKKGGDSGFVLCDGKPFNHNSIPKITLCLFFIYIFSCDDQVVLVLHVVRYFEGNRDSRKITKISIIFSLIRRTVGSHEPEIQPWNRLSTRCTNARRSLKILRSTIYSNLKFVVVPLGKKSEWKEENENHRKKNYRHFWVDRGKQVAWNKRAHLSESKRTNIIRRRDIKRKKKTNFSTHSA